MKRIQDVFLGIFLGLLVAAGLYAYKALKPSLPAVLGEAPAKFAGAKTETKDCKTVQALVPKAKKDVGLPIAIQKDDDTSLLAVAVVPRSDNPLWASAVLHRSTGVGEIYFTPQPLPWLAFNRRGALGVAYGARSEATGFVTRVYGRLDLVQVKRLHAGLLGDIDNAGSWYGGGFAELRF